MYRSMVAVERWHGQPMSRVSKLYHQTKLATLPMREDHSTVTYGCTSMCMPSQKRVKDSYGFIIYRESFSSESDHSFKKRRASCKYCWTPDTRSLVRLSLPSNFREKTSRKSPDAPFPCFVDQQPQHSKAQGWHDVFHGHPSRTEHSIEPSNLRDEDLNPS